MMPTRATRPCPAARVGGARATGHSRGDSHGVAGIKHLMRPEPARANSARLWAFAGTGPRVQRKAVIGAANDPAESEAERVADQVMRMPKVNRVGMAPAAIQRKCATCEQEEK